MASIDTTQLPNFPIGTPYNFTLTASGVTSPLRWTVAPDLPPGLALDSQTGVISGTATSAPASLTYKFTVTDDAGATATKTLVLRVITNTLPMSPRAARSLALYLVSIAIISGWLICTLWSSHPARNQTESVSIPVSGFSVVPDTLDLATVQNILLVGNFEDNAKVKFNNVDHTLIAADRNHILLSLNANDVSTLGPVLISVLKEDGSGAVSEVLSVVPARFRWKLLGFRSVRIDKELQLLILVLLVGMLGSSVYALKSLADYRGADRLHRSWGLYYAIQPLEGAGVAFIFYVLIRAGFLTAATNDTRSVNQFGMCAFAALAGTFSDLAFMKLREVFQTMFKPADSRGGKVDAVKITTTSFPNANVGQPYRQTLATQGGRPPFTWSVSPQLPAGLIFQNGDISGTPAAAMAATNFTFNVKDGSTPPTSDTVTLSLTIL